MDPLLINGILTGIRAGITWLTVRREGNRDAALDVIRSVDLRPFGLDEDALEIVNWTKAGLSYLSRRNVPVDETLAVIEAAEAEDRDVTPDELAGLIAAAQTELDATQDMIDELPDDEQDDGQEGGEEGGDESDDNDESTATNQSD